MCPEVQIRTPQSTQIANFSVIANVCVSSGFKKYFLPACIRILSDYTYQGRFVGYEILKFLQTAGVIGPWNP